LKKGGKKNTGPAEGRLEVGSRRKMALETEESGGKALWKITPEGVKVRTPSKPVSIDKFPT